jgi:DNA polymerase-3 subunit delta'
MSPLFKNIIGHQKQIQLLRDDWENENLAHAYLLAGPADLGKFTIAKAFVKTIQTDQLEEEHAYKISMLIDKGVHADTLFYQVGPKEESIKIAEIRSVLMNLQMTGDSSRRVLVMEDIDRMTPEAANAMLKILEEPPSKVLFIFTSSNPKAILETILSRVRRIDFQLMSNKELFLALKNRYRLTEEKKIYRTMELAQGRVAKAIKLLETDEHFQAYENIYTQIKSFLENQDIAAAFNLISQIHTDPILIQIFLEISFIVFRDDLKQAVAANDRKKQLDSTEKLMKLMEVRRLSETNVNSRLLLENFILSL